MRDAAEVRFIIDTMIWSFSRVNSYDSNCKYGWYLQYIEHEGGAPGFFGAFGSLCHEILEKYLKGELDLFDLSSYFETHYSEAVPMKAPPNNYVDLKESYFNKGFNYFDNYDNFDYFNSLDILGVEKKVEFEIDGYPFIGYIDLLAKDKRDGKLILIDHKSASIKTTASGAIAKKDKEHFLSFQRQQYLYSKAVIEEYGEGSVKALKWNMFKDQGWLECEWTEEGYNEALKWAVDTIHKIEEEEEWAMKDETDFFCNYLCDGREACPLYQNSRRKKYVRNSES